MKYIYLIGFGVGCWQLITQEAASCIATAHILIGSSILLSAIPAECSDAQRIEAVCSTEIVSIIEKSIHTQIVCIFSGDSGFCSGAIPLRKEIQHRIADVNISTLCGISSVQYFASQLCRPWQNWKLVNAHGKDCNIIGEILSAPFINGKKEIFFLTGGIITPKIIINTLTDILLSFNNVDIYHINISIGISLSEKEQIIIEKSIIELQKNIHLINTKAPSVVLITWYQPEHPIHTKLLLEDTDFIRDTVPMTKQETRLVIASRFMQHQYQTIYDIGAGTGSICIQVAKLLPFSSVYAIESNKEALRLISKNRDLHQVLNLTIVDTHAPHGLESLPNPDAVFIGGSSGNLSDIFYSVCKRNPAVRILLTAVTAETYAQAVKCCSERAHTEFTVTQLAINRSKTVTGTHTHHLFVPLSPVFLFDSLPEIYL